MKNLRDYLAEGAKDHVYIIKFAEQPTDEQVNVVKEWLKRYDLKTSTAPALIENDHKDFIDVANRQVHSMSVTLGTPVSSYILLQDLKTAANINEKMMVVRSENEPVEVYSQYDVWNRFEDNQAEQNGMRSSARLSTDREYSSEEQPTSDPLFGDDYNRKLLTYLAGVENTRPTMECDPPAPLFSWLQLEDISPGEPHQDTSDFNAHIDTPKPVVKGNTDSPVKDNLLTSHGAMSNNSVPKVKFFKDPKTGKTKTVVQPSEKE